MPAPALEVHQRSLGRRGEFTARCVWTAAESDDLENAVLLDTTIVSGRLNNVRFGITAIEWSGPFSGMVDVEFDSLPPGADRIVVTISPGSSGEIDFTTFPDGCKADPERDSPGDVVVTTRDAAPGDVLFLRGTYKEKGTATP